MRVPPPPSITVAPSTAGGAAPAITSAMRWPSTGTAPVNGVRPVPSRILALVIRYAITPSWPREYRTRRRIACARGEP
jgi:hypothetical protein